MGQHIVALNGCIVLHSALLDSRTTLRQFASAHFPADFVANLLDKHSSYSDDGKICLYLDPISGARPFSSDLSITLEDWAASIKLACVSVIDRVSSMALFAPERAIVNFGQIAVFSQQGDLMRANRDGEAVLQA